MEDAKYNETTKAADGKTFSHELSSVACLKAERWNNLNKKLTNSITKLFTEKELKFILDIHQGDDFDATISYRPKLLKLRIMETEKIDELIEKWGISTSALYEKILKLSNDDTSTIIDWACNYWDYNNLDL